MAYLTGYQYYENDGNSPKGENWGSYQYVKLKDIVNNFMLMYVGDDKLINNISRHNILFHAKRGIQELNYDALKEVKVLEMSVCDNLKLVLPPDYVNYIRISLYKDGTLFPLGENVQINYAKSYLQDNDCDVLFDNDGNVLEGTSLLDYERSIGQSKDLYLSNKNATTNGGSNDYNYNKYSVGTRFGLNSETANINPTFRIDKKSGVVNFSSEMSDQICVIEYISDGLENGVDGNVEVNKMAEEFLYSYIKYIVLSNKLGVQEYIVHRSRKEKTALLRNLKIRLSNIHPGALLMSLRGRDKWIK